MKKLFYGILCFLSISCEIENINYSKPIIITYEPLSVLTNSAMLSGKAIGEGGTDILEYGIVWSKEFPPTINDTKVIEGNRLGSFSNLYKNFESSTTYYFAAYGINKTGTGYGSIYEFTTSSKPICDPFRENYIDFGDEQVYLDGIKKQESTGSNGGNIEFIGNFRSSPQITLNFNEMNIQLPRTGEYVTVRNFDNQSIKSNGEVIVSISDFRIGGTGGGTVDLSEKIYVEEDDDEVTFIFCDTPVGDKYILNGKFTYVKTL